MRRYRTDAAPLYVSLPNSRLLPRLNGLSRSCGFPIDLSGQRDVEVLQKPILWEASGDYSCMIMAAQGLTRGPESVFRSRWGECGRPIRPSRKRQTCSRRRIGRRGSLKLSQLEWSRGQSRQLTILIPGKIISALTSTYDIVHSLVFLVDRAHHGGSWRQNVVDKDEDGLLGRQLDSLSDHVDKLPDREVLWTWSAQSQAR